MCSSSLLNFKSGVPVSSKGISVTLTTGWQSNNANYLNMSKWQKPERQHSIGVLRFREVGNFFNWSCGSLLTTLSLIAFNSDARPSYLVLAYVDDFSQSKYYLVCLICTKDNNPTWPLFTFSHAEKVVWSRLSLGLKPSGGNWMC